MFTYRGNYGCPLSGSKGQSLTTASTCPLPINAATAGENSMANAMTSFLGKILEVMSQATMML